MAAARRAKEVGADAVEVDVRLTRDGVPVLFHDSNLLRLAGAEGRIERMDLRALRELRTGSGAEREPIPTLRELVKTIPDPYPLNLELKGDRAGTDELLRAVFEALEGRSSVLLSSFDRKLLRRSRDLRPDLSLAPVGSREPGELLATGEELDAWSLHAHRRLVGEELIASARSRGRPLLVYTVNDPEEAEELFDRGVAGVFTDDPGRLVEVRNRWRSR